MLLDRENKYLINNMIKNKPNGALANLSLKNALNIKNNLNFKIFLYKAIDCYENVIKINLRKYL